MCTYMYIYSLILDHSSDFARSSVFKVGGPHPLSLSYVSLYTGIRRIDPLPDGSHLIPKFDLLWVEFDPLGT